MDFPNSRLLLASIEKNIEEGDFKEQDQETTSVLEKYWEEEFSTVVTYLSGINLSQYVDLFHDNRVDNEIFFSLTEEDLCDIGMENKKHREKLLTSISNRGQHRKRFGVCIELSPEDIMTTLDSTCKHVRVIGAALTSTRIRLKESNNHNSLLTTYLTSTKALAILCSEADVQAKLLNNQLNAILVQKPGVHQHQRRKYISVFLCSAMATFTAVVYWLRR